MEDTNPTTLVNELAATGLAIFDKEEERTQFCRDINSEIKRLKKRYRIIAAEAATPVQ